MSCCDLYASLHTYIAVRGGIVPTECTAASCAQSHLIRKLILETQQMRAGAALSTDEHQDMTLIPQNLTSAATADWVLLALIGRYVTKPQASEDQALHAYLEYDAVSGQIVVKQAQCQVQETVYEFMLVVSIVSIIALMTTQGMARHAQPEYTPVLCAPPVLGTAPQKATFTGQPMLARQRWRLGLQAPCLQAPAQ